LKLARALLSSWCLTVRQGEGFLISLVFSPFKVFLTFNFIPGMTINRTDLTAKSFYYFATWNRSIYLVLTNS
jgi:hypothetical protein